MNRCYKDMLKRGYKESLLRKGAKRDYKVNWEEWREGLDNGE